MNSINIYNQKKKALNKKSLWIIEDTYGYMCIDQSGLN